MYNTGSPENVLSYSQGTQQNQDEGCDGYIHSNPPGSPKYEVPIKKSNPKSSFICNA